MENKHKSKLGLLNSVVKNSGYKKFKTKLKKIEDILNKGEKLVRGQQLTSRNRRFKAVMQPDGNFVMYVDERPLWASNTIESGGGNELRMQHDGNLIVYDENMTPVWSSNTQLVGDYLMCRDDGNLGVFGLNGETKWTTGTTQSRQFYLKYFKKITFYFLFSGDILPKGAKLKNTQSLISSNGRFRATLSEEGRFGLYAGSRLLWQAEPLKGFATQLLMKDDGNLVLISRDGEELWSAKTRGDHLVCQDDGNLILFDASRKPVWSSETPQSKFNHSFIRKYLKLNTLIFF